MVLSRWGADLYRRLGSNNHQSQNSTSRRLISQSQPNQTKPNRTKPSASIIFRLALTFVPFSRVQPCPRQRAAAGSVPHPTYLSPLNDASRQPLERSGRVQYVRRHQKDQQGSGKARVAEAGGGGGWRSLRSDRQEESPTFSTGRKSIRQSEARQRRYQICQLPRSYVHSYRTNLCKVRMITQSSNAISM